MNTTTTARTTRPKRTDPGLAPAEWAAVLLDYIAGRRCSMYASTVAGMEDRQVDAGEPDGSGRERSAN